jgi:hypothetical protein
MTISLSGFFTEVETSIKAEWAKIEPELIAVFKAAEPYVLATAEELGMIAMQAVAGQATLTISGAEKFSVAVSNVITTLATQGKAVTLSNAAAAVQAAFNVAWAAVSSAPVPTLPTK